MSQSLFISYLGVVALITVSPGPDTALVVRNAVRFGTGDGLRTAAGSACGLMVWGSASGFGVAAVLSASASLFSVLRLLGGAYLVWLGVRLLVGALRNRSAAVVAEADQPPSPTPPGSFFRQGLATNLLNPKAAAFFTALLPQFVTSDGAGALLVTLGLATIACVASAAGLATYAAVASGLRRVLEHRVERVIDAVTGVVLIALGGRLAVGDRT